MLVKRVCGLTEEDAAATSGEGVENQPTVRKYKADFTCYLT